jgi:hypothetical protein
MRDGARGHISHNWYAPQRMDAKIVVRHIVAMTKSAQGAALILSCIAASGACADKNWDQTAPGRDMDRICNVMKYSGAADNPDQDSTVLTAQWLGGNLESEQTREFLAGLAQKPESDKASALEQRARTFGIGTCETAAIWRKPAP